MGVKRTNYFPVRFEELYGDVLRAAEDALARTSQEEFPNYEVLLGDLSFVMSAAVAWAMTQHPRGWQAITGALGAYGQGRGHTDYNTDLDELQRIAGTVLSDPELTVKAALRAFIKDPGSAQTWHVARWARASRPIYDLSEELAQGFLNTKLNVDPDEIVLPHPTIYLAFPPHITTVFNEATGEHPADGAFISLQEHDLSEAVSITDGIHLGSSARVANFEVEVNGGALGMLPGHNSVPLSALRSLSVLVVGLAHPGHNYSDNGLAKFEIPLNWPGELEDYCAVMRDDPHVRGSFVRNADRVLEWTRLILNTLVYLTSADKDVEYRPLMSEKKLRRLDAMAKRQRARFIRKHSGGRRVVYVGHNITSDDTKRKLTEGFRVRSHFRWARVGKGRKQRKWVVVKGHWRGPRDKVSEAVRVHDVVEEPQA